MNSFKLEKSGEAKNEAVTAGVFLALIGIPVLFLFSFLAGGIMILLGFILAVGGKFARS